MSIGIVTFRRPLWLLLVTTAVAGCVERSPNVEAPHSFKTFGELVRTPGAPEVLRTRLDKARGRAWTLDIEGDVRVHDERTRTLVRKIRLPGWLAVRTPCMPDLILDRYGSAYVSSNVKPTIWRIDAASFQMWIHELDLPGNERFDLGFTTLAFTRTGALYALAPSAASLWTIDVVSARATPIETYRPPLDECALTAEFLDRLDARR